MKADVFKSRSGFEAEMDAKPHSVCKRCGGQIFFYKFAKSGKWAVLSPLFCGGDGMQALGYHKCNDPINGGK